MNKEEFDRMMETSPSIPEKIVIEFKTKFNKTDSFIKIVKPEICDILIPTDDCRNQWFNDENKTRAEHSIIQLKLSKENKIKKGIEQNNKIVDDFITIFKNLNNREPLDTEIVDNLKDKIEGSIIQQIIDNKFGSANNV